MANRLYIAGAAPRSGKSAVSLGFMELFSAYGERGGFFRPVVATPNDSVIALMVERYRLPGALSDYYGCLADEAHRLSVAGNHDDLTKAILEKNFVHGFSVLRFNESVQIDERSMELKRQLLSDHRFPGPHEPCQDNIHR